MLTIYYRMCGTRRIEMATAVGEEGENILLEDGSWNPKSGTFLTAAQAAAKVCSCVSCGALRLEEEEAGKLDKAELRERIIREIYDLGQNEPISKLLLSKFVSGWEEADLEALLELRDCVTEALLELQAFRR